MVDLLLSPSCNWFQHNGIAYRSFDNIFATSCFRNVVVYKIARDSGPPEVVQFLAHGAGKVNGIAFHNDGLHPDYGNTVAVIGDSSTLSLINISTGVYLAQHQLQKNLSLQSLCWGYVSDEDVIAIVCSEGTLIVWHLKYAIGSTYSLGKLPLSLIEILPYERSKALITRDKTVLLCSLKDGKVLSEFKGHSCTIYDLQVYHGGGNPLVTDDLQCNTRWKMDTDEETDSNIDSTEDKSTRPFYCFATSDISRNIFIWDLSLKRFVAKLVVPLSLSFQKKPAKEKSSKHHITLCWVNEKLYSSTVMGEVLEWSISPSTSKHKVVHHYHTRVIYNMGVVNSILITSSQDRGIVAFNTQSGKKAFELQTLGGCPSVLSICPQDAHRIALGLQEGSIRILTFSGSSLSKLQFISQDIREKVLSLSWHPGQEGILLFGTSDGQVGLANTQSGKVTTFSYYHEKSTYKVEWAPPLNSKATGLNEPWYAYSFGNREIVIRNPANALDTPFCVNPLLNLSTKNVNSFSTSEFSFSPDYEYLAIGSLDGIIKVFERTSAKLIVAILRVRKTVQHLLWKPPSGGAEIPYVLAVGSAENNIYVFDLKKALRDATVSDECVTITQALKELSGHSSRVVWLSWSPHEDGILASASYDHTVQLWNTTTGEPVCNYGGHSHRVFRVEFAPFDADLMFSFAEENCVHQWRPSKISQRTSRESLALAKIKGRLSSKTKDGKTMEGEPPAKVKEENKTPEEPSVCSATSVKKPGHPRSFFPEFHLLATRKKSFHQLCILSLMEMQKGQKNCLDSSSNEKSGMDSDLLEVIANPSINERIERLDTYVESVLEKYGNFFQGGQSVATVEDMHHYITFFGGISDLDEAVSREIAFHKAKENKAYSTVMHCWQGSLESRLKWAAQHKQLDPFLISLAPQVSFSLWESVCESYAEQLVEEGQPVTAATYLLCVRKDEEAVDLLLHQRLFREAFAVAKYRMGFNREVVTKVVDSWTSVAVFEGNFELASILQLSVNNTENAARLMARRSEASSLIVAARLYDAAGQFSLAHSTSILALKEASLKNEFEKIDFMVECQPKLLWYKCISIIHEWLLDNAEQYYQGECGLSPFPSRQRPVSEGAAPPILIQDIFCKWKESGILNSYYLDYLKLIREYFETQNMPSTQRQLWFLIAKSLAEMMLLGSSSEKIPQIGDKYIDEIIKYLTFWEKNDQMYQVTHILLSKGVEDLSTLGLDSICLSRQSVTKLQLAYINSEITELLKCLDNDPSYCPWSETPPVVRNHSDHSSCDNESIEIIGQDSCDNNTKFGGQNDASVLIAEDADTKPPKDPASSEIEVLLSKRVRNKQRVIWYQSEAAFKDKFCYFISLLTSFWNSDEDKSEENSKLALIVKDNKTMGDVVVKLGQRAAISEHCLLDLMSRLASFKNLSECSAG